MPQTPHPPPLPPTSAQPPQATPPAAPRLCTVTPNPAIDRTAAVHGLTPGAVHRVLWEQDDAGGKGVNVASFLATWGLTVTATGLMGRDNADVLRALFAERGIDDRFVLVPGRTRTNIKLVDETRGDASVTDLNFPGFSVSDPDLERLASTLTALSAEHTWFVLAGSLPPGAPADTYRRLVALLRAAGRRTVLDTSGAPLAAALAPDAGALPDVIKPNEHELSELLGHPIAGPDAALAAARTLHRRGVGTVIVSMGARGAVFSEGSAACLAVPPQVAVRSTVGAGDAMVAGYLVATLRGLPLADRARLATAFSLGTLTTLGPRLPPTAEVEARAAEVHVSPLTSEEHGGSAQSGSADRTGSADMTGSAGREEP
ncbi:1-phosphofructokinase [Chondromyces apiculatus]|uniref:1-phosphofructokinase n=1 Tax=Chondromyces apiculatus DSM 436 TaxID=1192034 RepID=A0A017TBE9_9BACT|nr:1-phosphofructokinase [Chondromyces apiculatus]EYF05951.1 1-phosphofructokinase [Chondromyces apiculatus DSM 436]